MEKLKIGTVFSGIGALEHAFKRMEIPYEIKFACDTDDVDIFSRKIEGTYQDKIHEEIGELKNIAEKSNYRNRKKINNLSESDKNIKESQNMPIIYYRKINFPTSEEAYFWYGRDWTENNPQKVQKYYGKDIDIFHVPNPIDKLNQFNYTSLHKKVEKIIENHELISDYVWIDNTDVLLFPDKPNNIFTFDIFLKKC